jgi:hypothetical protein
MRDLLHPVVVSLALVAASAPTAGAQTMPAPAAAPRIIVAPAPAVLIRIDGRPIYQPVAGTELQRIVNTRPLIVRDELGGHFLRILDGWMEAYSLDDAWSIAGVPPKGSGIALSQAVASKDVDLLDSKGPTSKDPDRLINERMPAIYISTEPAALVVTDGPPRFVPVAGTALEYMQNATPKVFREPTDHELYVLLSGRWFRSWTTEGPWQYIPSAELPADFAKIPAALLK